MSNTTFANEASQASMDLFDLQKSLINGNTADDVMDDCVLDLVQKQIQQRPDDIAINAWDGDLTYAQLANATNNIAKRLGQLGNGHYVALCVPRTKWTPIAMLAALQTGAAFVHLDPAYPASRISAICAACNITRAICVEGTADVLAAHVEHIVTVNDDDLTLTTSTLPALGGRNTPSDTCYIVFTSGSSGNPKGVVVPHSAICTSIRAQGLEFQLSPTTRVLQFAPATFDASMFELITTLCFGSCVCIPSQLERENDPVAVLNRYRTDVVFLTPSVARTVEPENVPLLKTLIVGGEAPDEALIDRWLSQGRRISNVYGPSECAVSAAVLHYNAHSRVPAATIGGPFGGGLWVVDPDDHDILVEPGETGELMISGRIVTDGYLNDPVKTNAVFVRSPKWWRNSSSGRSYKTGDLVKYGRDGLILYIGRKDSQVKVRGQRLELGEVEYHLRQNALVGEAAACVPRSGLYNGHLTAVLTLRAVPVPTNAINNTIEPIIIVPGSSISQETLQVQQALEKLLPPYMVPTQWLVLQSMPRSASDKLDVRRIQTWIEAADPKVLDPSREEFQLPTTVSEEILLAAWKRVLNDATLGITDQFIRRGGDSILAMQVVSECRKHNLNVSVRSLLAPQSLANVAQEASMTDIKTTEREEERIGEPFGLSPIQKLYFESDPEGKNMCNQSVSLSLKGDVKLEVLQEGLAAVVSRHSMLRARFAKDEAHHWTQHITLDVAGSFILRKHQPESNTQKAMLIDESERSIDIRHGPVLTADIFEVQGQQTMHFAAHHLLVDFVSWRVILDDLDTVLNGDLISLQQDEPIPFSQWTRLQAEYAQTLPALPVNVEPASYTFWELREEDNTVSNSTETSFELDTAASEAILGPCNIPTASEPVDLLMAALLYSFNKTFSTERGAPQMFAEGHGREPWDASLDISGTVGWFTTMYPITLEQSSLGEDITDIIRAVSIARRSLSHNGLDYFTSRYLSTTRQESFAHHSPMEILFNFGGSFMTTSQHESSSHFNFASGSNGLPFDEKRTGKRLALFEITSIVKDGHFIFNFQHPQTLQRSKQVLQWFQTCQETLMHIAHELPSKARQLHVAEFPLIDIPHSVSSMYVMSLSNQLGLQDLSAVEDIYPCSAIQRGILVSQSQQSHLYQLFMTWDVTTNAEHPVDIERFTRAWQQVVNDNAILRTVFIDDTVGADAFHQVTLHAGFATAWTEELMADVSMKMLSRPTYSQGQPHHRLAVQKCSTGTLKCRLDINHALADGSSLALVVDQIQRAYAGTPISKRLAYRDYVGYQQTQKSQQATHLDYWRKYLADAIPCLFPALAAPTTTSLAAHRFEGLRTIHCETLDRNVIQSFCQEYGVTISSVFQLVWALCLQAYTHHASVSFGYLVSQRDLPLHSIENAVGPYINTLVRRIDLNGDSSSIEVLRRLQDDLTEGLEHGSSPLSDVLRNSNVSHGGGLYNTSISYQRYATETTTSHELLFSRKTLFDPSEDMVALDVDDYGTHVDPFVTYWQSSLSDEHAQKLADTVASAVASLIRGHETKLSQLSIVPQQQITEMQRWNEKATPSEQCLHDLVSQQAQHAPEAVAVESRDGRFTYAEIEDLSSRLARFLIQEHQIELEQKVLFCSEKTSLAVIIILGILKAGGACVAIDPAQPLIRLQHITKETDAKLAFASETTLSKMTELALSVITFTADFLFTLPAESCAVLARKVQPDNLAVVVYTSGSTGMPKGIMLEHGSLCASILAHANALKIDGTTRALQFASWSFDVSIEETFTTLSQGGCVCVPSEWDRKNDLAAFIREFNVNWVDLVPGMARQLQPESIPSVKTMILGGERLPVDVARKWANNVHLINVYGPAECSINATYDDSLTTTSDGSTIGLALQCTRAWVVNTANHDILMPIGGIGELVLSGPTVMRGYINDETRTAAAIFTGPAWATPHSTGERFYKTGDLVRLDSNGKIFLLGRKDAQRKLRGHRIDLEEIQQVISDSSQAATCTVALPRSGPFKDQVVAVVVLKTAMSSQEDASLRLLSAERIESIRPQLKDVRSWVSARLPTLMVPTAWAVVTSIPELASGKLNVSLVARWLAELDGVTTRAIQDTLQETIIQPPTNETEVFLLGIWAAVLHRPGETIGVNRSFLSAGGDSLAAMQIRSRAKNLGLAVSVENLLSGLTIADIARNAETVTAINAVVSQDDSSDAQAPLTAIQKTYLSGATPTTLKRFNLATLLKVMRPVSAEDVRRALLIIAMRHGALRTRFVHRNAAWSREVNASPEETFSLSIKQVTNEQHVEAAIEDAQNKVDVLKGPGLVACLLVQPSSENMLFLTAHHLLVDIVSWQIITDELQEALQTGDIASASPLSFNSWCRHVSAPNIMHGANLEKWSAATHDAASRTENVYGDAVDMSFILDPETTSSLLAICKTTNRVELVELLLTAVIAGYQHTFDGQPLPRVLNEDHGRQSSHPDFDPYGTIGWFTSMSPVFTDKSDIHELLQQVKTSRRKFAGSRWLTSYMQSATNEDEAVATLESADILFNYVGHQHSDTQSAHQFFSRIENKFVQSSSVAHDLVRPARYELLAMVQDGQLQIEFAYNNLLDGRHRIKEWCSNARQAMIDLSKLPAAQLEQITISDCKLISTDEKSFEQILARVMERGGVSSSDIEDIYPCHPVQEGMLVSQARNPNQYMTSSTWEVVTKDGSLVDVERLCHAWETVVQKHDILRTFFVEGAVRAGSLFAQVVLKSMTPRVVVLATEASYDHAVLAVEKVPSIQASTRPPLHQMTICQGGTRTACRLDISHTIIDGASMHLLIKQLSTAYDSLKSSILTESSYKPLINYWLETMPDNTMEQSLQFWQNHLAGVEPCHFPKLAETTADKSVDLMPIALSGTERLRDMSKAYGLTPFNIVQIAWSLVLRAFTGNDTVCFGYLTSGRHRPISKIEEAIGPYFTMMVCKAEFNSSSVLLDSLRGVQTAFLDSFNHQEVPLSSIQHALGLRDGTTLFNTLLTYQASADRETNQESLTFNEIASYDPTEFDITLGVIDTPTGMTVGMEYTRSCLGQDQARLVADAVSQAIENIIQDPMQTVSGNTLVGPTQRQFILDTNAAPPIVVDELLHEEISRLAAISPNAAAVQSWDGSLNRAELDQLSSTLAAHLLTAGVVEKPGQIIPLCFNKSKWAIVSVIAVLKTGGAVTFMPLDGSPDQLRQMADVADANTVLGDAMVVSTIEAAGLKCLAVTPALLAGHVPTPPRTPTEQIRSTDVSFVVFTSGSTGTPKAVVHTHGSVAATAFSERLLGINTPETRRLQFAGFSFDVAVTDVISTLRAGGCVCIPSEHERIHELASTIERMSANAANLTPTVVRTLQPAEIPSMKSLLVGGEALSKDIIQTWSPHVKLVNSYGPAESGINGVCNFDVHPDSAANIGRPFPTMRTWLVDPANLNMLAPVGAIGEIILEGSGVAREYLKDPERTASAFPAPPAWYQALPFSSRGQGRLYATGDLARYAADGTVEFLGRKNQETKLHGHRIDLQAVEDGVTAALKDNSFLVAAEVVNVQNLGKRILAFVSPRNHVHSAAHVVSIDDDTDGRFSGQRWTDLRQEMRHSLSKHSIPTALVPVYSMPLTQSRKIHRRALRELDLEAFMQSARVGAVNHTDRREPASEHECLLQQLWAKAIGIDHDLIGLDDQFFDMGGDSVGAMALAGLARDAGLSLKTSLVFQRVTLEGMAKTLTGRSEEVAVTSFSLLGLNQEELQDVIVSAASACSVTKDSIEDLYPCTPLQEGLLALSGSHQDAYISTETIQLTPGIDISRLERSINTVAQAEPILRTRLVFVKGRGTLQVVVKENIAFSTADNVVAPAMVSGKPLIWFGLSEDKAYLTWVMHHAIYDGFSRKLLLEKIQACYKDEQAVLTPSAPYSSYVAYTSNSSVHEEARTYWKNRLNDAATPTFPRLASTKQNVKPWTNAVMERQLALPRLSHGITAATVVQTAWAMTVAQHSDHGTDDVIFGMTVSGRDAPVSSLDQVTGPCIATVPVRMHLPREATVMEVLRGVQDDNLVMMPYVHVGLQDIAKSLPKEATHVCGFRSSLVIQPAQLKELGAEGFSFGTLVLQDDGVEAHPFAIVAECGLAADCIELYIMFDDRAVDVTEMDWILSHFDEAIQGLGWVLNQADTVKTLSSLKTHSPAEMSMMRDWNGPHPEVVDSCLHDLFLQTVARQPEAIAIDSHEGKWTYRQLDNVSNILAHDLQRRGVEPESMVSVCFGKTVWAIVSILAIWKAGGAYVPLDPLQPVQRLHGLIEQAKSKLVLAGTSVLAANLTDATTTPFVVVVDAAYLDALTAGDLIKEPMPAMATPTNTCFVLFTSGSTGQPKGVVMTHRTIATTIAVQTASIRMQSTSRVLHYSSLTFDMSVLELYGTLALGGCICIPSDDERMSDIGGFMARQGVTWAFMTPTTANAIPNPPASLRTLVLGGEAVTQDIPARWPSNVEVLSGYGPTEVSVVCAIVDIRREPLPTGLIGHSTGGKMWLVEPGNAERVVSLGEVGEIMVSSVMLAEGYFGDEKRTKAAFKPRPTWLADLIQDSPERVYMTGDLAVHLPSGELVSLGRADSQVKINGQRIELGEVEQQLIASGCATGEAVVEVCKMEAWEDKKMLVAFIQTGKMSGSLSTEICIDSTLSAKEKMCSVRTAVMARLPRPWTPAIFVPIEVFPRSVSGKTDRKALRAMIQASSVDQLLSLMSAIKTSHVEVSTENERLLQAMWSSVLHIPATQISASNVFTDMGGDSVASIRLSALALQQGWSLRVAHIMLHSSLQAMAKVMKLKEGKQGAALAPFDLLSSSANVEELAVLCGFESEAIEDAYPCTPLQEGIMAISQSRPGTYIGNFVYKLHSCVAIEALQLAWNAVLARNSILRTRILATDNDGYVQVVRKHEAMSVPVIAMDELKKEQETQQKNMVLGKSLVFAALAQADQDRYLSLTIHHSIYDGWSMPLLMDELEEAIINGPSPTPLPSRFNEFVAFIQHDKQASVEFWRAQLNEAQPVDFPTRPSLTYESQTDSMSITKLQCPAQKLRSAVTLPLMLRTAWAMVLSRYTASDDVLFGAVLSGRNAPVAGIDRLPAPTFTTVPVRMRLQDTPTLESLFKQVREQSVAMIPHEQLGLRSISQQFTKDSGMLLNFNNLLLVQTSERAALEREDRALMPEESLSQTMSESYGLVVECVPEADDENNVTVHIHHDSRLLSAEAVSWLMQHFQEAVHWVCTAPTTSRLTDFDMASAADQIAVKAWNQPCPPFEKSCIHWTIQQQTKAQPDAIALDATVGGQWTYHALDEASSRLALHLIHLGVEPESSVPVMFEKGAWAIVAMLAVFKAGGAYVPLDPKDAVGRHQHILRQTKATLVLAGETDALAEHSIRCIAVDAVEMKGWPTDTALISPAQPHNAAYVLFTSGSTGVPKGVVMDHSSLATAAAAMRTRFELGPHSRVYNFSSFTFDVSILDIFIALSSGATVCLPSEAQRLDDLSGSLQRFRASFAFLTPTMASLVDPDTASGMDTIVLGGEAVTEDALVHCRGAKNILAGYGPTETCILSASGSLQDVSRSCIGRPLGGQLWIIDPLSSSDGPRLAAIGCEGELVISGNTLARHYLGDAEKTAAAFIENVNWLSDQSTQRLYRTGDRVRFQPDGTVMFLGRLDAQIKHNGRRLELGEIEYHVAAAQQIEHAIISYPARGPWKKTLTAVVELAGKIGDQLVSSPDQQHTLDSVLLTPDHQINTALTAVRSELATKLPSYMMPQAWIIISKMPRGSAAKIDRARITRWVTNASEETYENSQSPVEGQTTSTKAPSSIEEQIRNLWAAVLNRPAARIAVDVPFPQFSGDSVSAIQVASKAKRAGLSITAQDVLRSQTIERLAIVAEEAAARNVDAIQAQKTRPEFIEDGQPFPLSPIQRMYFRHIAAAETKAAEKESHFNQSFLLQLSPTIGQNKLEMAIRSLVERNPMLRVRFHQGPGGNITQAITTDTSGSYGYHNLGHCTATQANEHISVRQKELHPGTGPIFFATTMQIDGHSLLILSALHLIVDLVSWRVIAQQLKQLLTDEAMPAPLPSTGFHEWTVLQEEQIKVADKAALLPQPADLNFWGMAGQESTYEYISQASFSLDDATSTLLLSQSNKSLASETIDSLTASLAMSFARAFPERTVPAIHLEGHGRESWDDVLDIGQTVGWFTTMYPCTITVNSTTSTVAAVRAAKDFRVRAPGRGRPYFASRYGNDNERDDEHHQMEILLNYAGGYGEIEGEDSDALLCMPDEAVANQIDNHCIGKNIRRPALVEIYAAVNYGKLEVSFTWSSQMQHQSRIRQWIDSVDAMLQRTARELVEVPAQPTLSDLELFDGDHDNLDAIIEGASASRGSMISADIADIYPATALQKRMIMARHSGAQLFNVKQAYQFLLKDPINKVILRLSSAWQQVLQKHAALRSIIVEDNRDKLYNVVFQQTHATITTNWLTSGELTNRLSKTSSSGSELPTLELLLEKGSDTAYVLLQISHTICDASSLAVMMNDLQAAYHGKLDSTSRSGMVHKKLSARHNLSTTDNHASIEYWRKLLAGSNPANFPSSGGSYRGMYTSEDLNIPYTPALRTLGERHGTTLATTLQAAWALTLHSLLDQQDITFGYFSSGRDQPISGIESAVGLFMNLCASRTRLDPTTRISTLLRNIQEDFSQGLQHQSACLDVVNDHVAAPLFNTAFNFPKSSAAVADERTEVEDGIDFEAVGGVDPMDFAILVRVRDVQTDEGISVSLEYWPDQTDTVMVKKAGEVFVRAMAWIARAEGCDKALAFC